MIAVLGATGRVGRAVLAQLAEAGADAFGVARRPVAAPLPVRRAHVLEPGSLRGILHETTRLFLLAPSGPQQEAYEAAVLDAALAAGVEHIVKVSGGAASLGPNGTTATAVAHWRSEQAIERSGLGFSLLRPSFFAQNLLDAPAALSRATGVLPDPFAGAAITAVDVRDLAACAVACLLDPAPASQAWRITGLRPVTMPALARHLGLASLRVPPTLTARSLRRQGASAFEIDHALRMAAYFAAGSDATATDHVQRLTGRAPRSAEAFLDEHRAAFLPAHRPARLAASALRTLTS